MYNASHHNSPHFRLCVAMLACKDIVVVALQQDVEKQRTLIKRLERDLGTNQHYSEGLNMGVSASAGQSVL